MIANILFTKQRTDRLIRTAKAFAIAAHEACGQKRKYSGEPYWHHPNRVSSMVLVQGMRDECVAAAWLHDVVEDTEVGIDIIRGLFGGDVARLVSELTTVSRPADGNRATRKAIDRAFLSKASAEAQTIKCFDIMDNMADIWENDPDFAERYSKEKIALLDVMTRADPSARGAAYLECRRGL